MNWGLGSLPARVGHLDRRMSAAEGWRLLSSMTGPRSEADGMVGRRRAVYGMVRLGRLGGECLGGGVKAEWARSKICAFRRG